MALDTPKKRALGAALVQLRADVLDEAGDLVRQAREAVASNQTRLAVGLLRQAIDAPRRARAKLTHWAQGHDEVHGAGAAVALFSEGLAIYGAGQTDPVTLAEIDADLSALETSARQLASGIKAGTVTWEQAADAIEQAVAQDRWNLSLRSLPLPPAYKTIWDSV